MATITANDIKRRGVASIAEILENSQEATISVRGQSKYVVMNFKKHPELLSQYEKCLQLMEINPFHTSLRLHPLRGKLSGLYSVSITLGYRFIIEFLIENKEIIPIHIGTHDEVYS